jgi:phycocyanin beta chain
MVLDAFSKVVAQADARGEYLTSAQLDALLAVVKDSDKRLDVVKRISDNQSSLAARAARDLFAEQPQLVNPGGNAYTNRRAAACLQDLEIILRYITYAMFTGDSSVLDDIALNGLRETYQALGTPGASVAVGIMKMKDASIAIVNDPNGITRGDCSALTSELASYFDRAAAAVV